MSGAAASSGLAPGPAPDDDEALARCRARPRRRRRRSCTAAAGRRPGGSRCGPVRERGDRASLGAGVHAVRRRQHVGRRCRRSPRSARAPPASSPGSGRRGGRRGGPTAQRRAHREQGPPGGRAARRAAEVGRRSGRASGRGRGSRRACARCAGTPCAQPLDETSTTSASIRSARRGRGEQRQAEPVVAAQRADTVERRGRDVVRRRTPGRCPRGRRAWCGSAPRGRPGPSRARPARRRRAG